MTTNEAVTACPTCYAQVAHDDMGKHQQWHNTLTSSAVTAVRKEMANDRSASGSDRVRRYP